MRTPRYFPKAHHVSQTVSSYGLTGILTLNMGSISVLSGKEPLVDHAMFEFREPHNHPGVISFSEYGYDNDSDLEDDIMEDKQSTELQVADNE